MVTETQSTGDVGAVEIWESDEDDSEESQDKSTVSSYTKLVTFVCVFLLSWQTIFRIPNVAIRVMFRFLSLFLKMISEISRSEKVRMMYDIFPNTLEKARVMQF